MSETRKSLVLRLKKIRQLNGPRVIIRNAQIGLAVIRRGYKWSQLNPSAYQRNLETRYMTEFWSR